MKIKKKKIGSMIFSCIFFIVMLLLTIAAPSIHRRRIPNVHTIRLTRQPFPMDDMDSIPPFNHGMQHKLAIPSEYADEKLYVLYEGEKNETMRYFVREVFVELGEEYNGYYEVKSGVTTSDILISETNKELYDGAEVFVIK